MLIAVAGAPLGEALSALREGMYGTPYALGASLNSAALLALVGGGYVVAARCGLTTSAARGRSTSVASPRPQSASTWGALRDHCPLSYRSWRLSPPARHGGDRRCLEGVARHQ